MDTITHFAVGACIGELVASKRIGKRAIVIGGMAQLIPDIDIMFSLWLAPASNALAHRGFTHSFLFLFIATLFFASIQARWWKDKTVPYSFWIKIFALEIFVHLFLDAFNAYGTGWFEPFSHTRISFNTVFVADPFFSIPVGIALLFLVFTRMTFAFRKKIAIASLTICSAYLIYGVVNKLLIKTAVEQAFQEQHISSAKYFTTPTPFNNWLWYIVSTDSLGSYVGYKSVFDRQDDIPFHFFPRNDSLLSAVSNHEELDKLIRLSQGHYTVENQGDTLVFNDLRFGQMLGWQNPRAGFVFHYYLSPPLDNTLVLQRGRFAGWDKQATRVFINRIFDIDNVDRSEEN